MKIYDISINSIKRRKSKAILLLLGLSFSIASVIVLISISLEMEQNLEESLDDFGANIIITPDKKELNFNYAGISFGTVSYNSHKLKEDELLKIWTIKNKENIKIVSPKLINISTLNESEIMIAGVHFNQEILLKTWWDINGNVPVQKNETLIGSIISTKLNVHINDEIILEGKKFIVTGIINPTGSQDDEIVFIDLAVMQKLYNQENEISLAEVSALCYDCPIEEIVRQASEKLPGANIKPLKQAIESKMAAINSFNNFSYGISLVIIIISIMIVFSNVNSSVIERKREIGIFKSIGYKNIDISIIILAEILLISVVAGIIGYFMGLTGSHIFMPFVIESSNLQINFSWSLLSLATILSASVAVVASLIPLNSAIKLDPISALKSL
ncbi:MAG: ABC transporter permease [Melioribacteraceae bacterium]|nr:ABC transporter permease [Melioribacteraceae bacterium]